MKIPKILKRNRGDSPKKEKRGFMETVLSALGLTYGFGSTATSVEIETMMKISTVYRCVDAISDGLAVLPMEVQRLTKTGWSVDQGHSAVPMLNLEPNPLMSSWTFMKALVIRMLLDGNGYAEIVRDKALNPVQLLLITDPVVVSIKDGLLYYTVKPLSGQERILEQSNVIHVLNYTFNGLIGVSTLTYAANTLQLTQAAETSAKGFFDSGANLSGIISMEGKLNPQKAADIKTAWATSFNSTDGSPQGIAVLEGGANFQAVQISPKDAQMLESRTFNGREICRFFSVSPVKVFDYANANQGNHESMQLSFLTDTINPLVHKIENELNRKLFKPSERAKLKVRFDVTEILRTDLDTAANYFRKMADIGVFSPNEIRARIGNPPAKGDGGDESYIQVNLEPLSGKVTKQKIEQDERSKKLKSTELRSKGQ